MLMLVKLVKFRLIGPNFDEYNSFRKTQIYLIGI